MEMTINDSITCVYLYKLVNQFFFNIHGIFDNIDLILTSAIYHTYIVRTRFLQIVSIPAQLFFFANVLIKSKIPL